MALVSHHATSPTPLSSTIAVTAGNFEERVVDGQAHCPLEPTRRGHIGDHLIDGEHRSGLGAPSDGLYRHILHREHTAVDLCAHPLI